ncbi:MAG: hypothetical protein OEM94_07690 [Acidimicrobiia bacterium]|nr:hypothetical protein [Acidimicrobiia bacterium]
MESLRVPECPPVVLGLRWDCGRTTFTPAGAGGDTIVMGNENSIPLAGFIYLP